MLKGYKSILYYTKYTKMHALTMTWNGAQAYNTYLELVLLTTADLKYLFLGFVVGSEEESGTWGDGVCDHDRIVVISVGRYGVGVDRIDKGSGEIEVDEPKRE